MITTAEPLLAGLVTISGSALEFCQSSGGAVVQSCFIDCNEVFQGHRSWEGFHVDGHLKVGLANSSVPNTLLLDSGRSWAIVVVKEECLTMQTNVKLV